MFFYTLIDHNGGISFSPVPEVDKRLTGGTVVSPGYPLEILLREFAVEKIKIRNIPEKHEAKTSPDLRCLEDEELFHRFLQVVRGRILAVGEFSRFQQYLQVDELTLLRLMQKAVINKAGEWVPALRRTGKKWSCERCGSLNCREWPSQFGDAATCQDCQSIGALTSLQALFRWISPDSPKMSIPEPVAGAETPKKVKNSAEGCSNDGNLFDYTPAQRRIADDLYDYGQDDEVREVLIWAACGAGKTEVCFPLIQKTLSENKFVLFAAPRQDVVHDVHRRLQKYFSGQKVKVLSGAVGQDFEPALLTVATTHQVLRFHKAFDLVVFDEIDAYPYTANHILAYGLQQAIKDYGKMIYLTATPSEEVLQKCRRGECSLLRLAQRFHGYPLPVPAWQKMRIPGVITGDINDLKKNRDLRMLFEIIKEMSSTGPLLIFVPTIALVKVWLGIIDRVFNHKTVGGSWSSDPERTRKVTGFLHGEIDIFICTSILERGVTVDNVQVLVLYADHNLYDIRSLVQMAGRTGRTPQHPVGCAVFVAAQKTKDMARAIAWIIEQNAIGGRG